jgi:hypothetical protein
MLGSREVVGPGRDFFLPWFMGSTAIILISLAQLFPKREYREPSVVCIGL